MNLELTEIWKIFKTGKSDIAQSIDTWIHLKIINITKPNKQIMKKLLLFLALLMPVCFTSCGDDDEPEAVKIPVTSAEIQGDWAKTYRNNAYFVSFRGDDFSLLVMDMDTKEITNRQFAKFRIEGTTLRLTDIKVDDIEFITDGCDIYWYDEHKIMLFVGMLQGFYRTK